MNLRLSCIDSGETQRIEIPSPYTFLQLRQTLTQSIRSPFNPSFSLRFSLNGRDNLSPQSPATSLESLGINSCDLVYFSIDPHAFSPNQMLEGSSSSGKTSILGAQIPDLVKTTANLGVNRPNQENAARGSPQMQNPASNQTLISAATRPQGQNLSNQPPSQVSMPQTLTDIEGDSVAMKLSEPYFLRKVLREELGEDDRLNHKLMVIAVHSVILESGLIGYDPVSKMPIDRFHRPDDWPSAIFPILLCYTLPTLLPKSNSGTTLIDFVAMTLQNVANIIHVTARLFASGSSVYRICIDESKIAPILDSVWLYCDEVDWMDEDEFWRSKKEVFNFWKMLKDRLTLPLLIDLCEKSGLALPPCFTRLPTDLKLKILESLPGKDLAKVGCVSSEMRYLAYNNDLWKKRVMAEFGYWRAMQMQVQGVVNWREKFISLWRMRKMNEPRIRPRMRIMGPPNKFGLFPVMVDRGPDMPSLMKLGVKRDVLPIGNRRN